MLIHKAVIADVDVVKNSSVVTITETFTATAVVGYHATLQCSGGVVS